MFRDMHHYLGKAIAQKDHEMGSQSVSHSSWVSAIPSLLSSVRLQGTMLENLRLMQ